MREPHHFLQLALPRFTSIGSVRDVNRVARAGGRQRGLESRVIGHPVAHRVVGGRFDVNDPAN